MTVSLWRIGHLGSSLLEIWMLVSKPASLNVFSLIPSLLSPTQVLKGSPGEAG